PWNPVIVKNALPNWFRPLNLICAWVNSQIWPASKRTPRMMVEASSAKNMRLRSWEIASRAKWQVTPLESRMTVLKKGIGHQLTGTVSGGGQLNGCDPNR